MEILGLVDVPGWIVGILTLIFTVCIYTWYKQSFFTRLGIKTKQTTFLLGDLPLIVKKGFSYIDEPMVAENGKVFGVFMGNIPSLVISDPEIIKHILVKDFSNFTDKMMFPLDKRWWSALPLANGSYWKFLRNTLSPTFSSGKMRHMMPLIQQCTKDLLEIIDEHIEEKPEGFDLIPILQGYTMDVICKTGFGLEVSAQRDPDNPFIKRASEVLNFSIGKNPLSLLTIMFPCLVYIRRLFPLALISEGAWQFFKTTTTTAFNDRKSSESKHRDLLQLMINAHKGNTSEDNVTNEHEMSVDDFKKRGLTDDEVLINSIIFMVAGFDTTAAAMSWILYELVLHPEHQQLLMDEITSDIGDCSPDYDNVSKLRYLDMIVNETLRIHPLTGRINRKAKEDVEICGVYIKKNMDIVFSPFALHLSPDYWENPLTFNPERFAPENKHAVNEYAYMPFGIGPRGCVGKRLAILEVKLTIVSLLQKYRFYKTDQLQIPMPISKMGVSKMDKPFILKVERR